MKVMNIGRAMCKPKPPDDGVDLRVNDEVTPQIPEVRTVTGTGVVPAYYPHPAQPHGHHLQSANDDIAMATWGWNEQGRDLHQEDENHDETIKR